MSMVETDPIQEEGMPSDIQNEPRSGGLAPGVPKHSPWGKVISGKVIASGIIEVRTASHGGIRVYSRLNQTIPRSFRTQDGWYEKSVMAAVPACFLHHFFEPREVLSARKTLRYWKWREWENHFKEVIPLTESGQKAVELWMLSHAEDLVGIADYDDSHSTVPEGKVGVCAAKGGTRDGENESYWLVDSAEYESRWNNPGGYFVIDPSSHEPWEGPYPHKA